MSSAAQIQANRANGQHSAGPAEELVFDAYPFAMLRKKALMREDPVLLGLAANAANKTPNKPQNPQNPDEANPTSNNPV